MHGSGALQALVAWDQVATLGLHGVAGLPPPRAWITFWWAVGLLGTGFVAIPVLLAVYRPGASRDALRRRALVALAGMLVPLAVVHTLKPLVARPRPAAVLGTIHAAEPLLLRSFPSGHAAAAAAAATLIALLSRRRAVIALVGGLLAGMVGFSRVALGVHFLADVLGGLVIGCAAAYLVARPLLRRREAMEASAT